MPSFDIVSQVDWHEVTNAIDQTNREVSNRFDFKGSDARVAQDGESLIIHGDDEYRIGQVKDILEIRLTKRGIDIRCLLASAVRESSGGKAQQELKVRAGIDGVLAKKLVQVVKASKMKVQSSIQSEQVRITGIKRDDLQSIIKIIEQEELTLPLQFVNFRD